MRHIRKSFVFGVIGLCAVLLGGCAGNGDKNSTVRLDNFNQLAIRVDGELGVEADKVLFKRQGFEQAKLRFFQMDISRRIASGRLGELYGAEAFDGNGLLSDVTIWSLGLPHSSQQTLRRLEKDHPEILALLQAFADGVNEYVMEIATLDPALLKQYRSITHNQDYFPQAWSPIDSVAVGTQMAFLLSNSFSKKATLGTAYLAIAKNLEGAEENIEKFLDLRPMENEFILPVAGDSDPAGPVAPNRKPYLPGRKGRDLFNGVKNLLGAFTFSCPDKNMALLGGSCSNLDTPGSNNWVVSSRYTGNGQTYLANDPHLNLSFPSTFVEVALDSKHAGGSFYIRGVVPAGLPGILIGHNEDIAWGFTNSMSDVDELYGENFNTDKPGYVRRPNKKWVKLEEYPHTFLVRQADGSMKEETRVLRWSPGHGPILTDHIRQFKKIGEAIPNTGFSYKWTGHDGGTEVVALMGLARAKNYGDFKAALQHFEVGAQNIVYSDRQGNIGYYSHGHFPMRPYLENEGAAPPYLPDMSYGENEWGAWRKNVPELYNPEKGYIVTANNDPFGYNRKPNLSNFKDYFGFRFAPGSRAKRISDLIQTYKKDDGVVTVEDMRKVQYDHKDLMFCRLVSQLETALPQLELPEAEATLAKRIVAWKADGCFAKRSDERLAEVTVWVSQLLRTYYGWLKSDMDAAFTGFGAAERNGLFSNFVGSSFALDTVYHKANEGLDKSAPETLKLYADSLQAGVREVGRLGVAGVRWGQVHPLEFYNVFAEVLPTPPHPRMERDGNLGTVDMGGFDVVPVVAGTQSSMRVPNVWGPNFRLLLVLEEGKPIDGYNVLPGGNTSSLESEGALNELLMWRDGQQRRLVRFVE
ncbi:MAG: penicillin acylase family protein [Bdellovibrionaceae bacterium]|nr:penicillin acylase family protein [Bdellovibrionales bacterium]MCB9254306.1 penicillin acylase family protein [Pseudobdellovibrionaceae bacterium]